MLLKRILSVIYIVLFIPTGWLGFVALAFSSDSVYGVGSIGIKIFIFFIVPPLLLLVAGAGGLACSFGGHSSKKDLAGRIFVYLPLISLILYIALFLF